MTMSPTRLPVATGQQARAALWEIIKADRYQAIYILLLYALSAAGAVALPVLLGEVIDGINAGWSVTHVNIFCAAIVGTVAAQLLLSRYGRLKGYQFGERAAATLRSGFIARVLSLPLGTVERAGAGDLGTRTSDNITQVADLLRRGGPEVVLALIEVTVILAAAFIVDIRLGAVFSLGLIPSALIMWWFMRSARPLFLAELRSLSEGAQTLSASAAGSRTVVSYQLQTIRQQKGYAAAEDLYLRLRRVIRLESIAFPAFHVTFRVQTFVLVFLAGWWYLGGALSIGAVVAIAMLSIRMNGPVTRIFMHIKHFQRATAAMARLQGVHAIEEEPRTAQPRGTDLRLDHVTFGYDDGPDVLHDVTLHPRPAERLVVVGPSGAGKSTIARLVAGIDRPRSGTVTIGGASVADVPLEHLRRHVILVTQESYVFSMSVRENLTMANPEATDEELLEALEKVGARWLAELPDGLDTQVGSEQHVLSLAEAQQLALARVIVADPKIVVLDEATGGIDPGSAGRVEATLASALEGRTVIAIAHQLHAAESADRIAVVDHGRIAELGTHAELVEANGTYARLWRAWKGDRRD
ncbi:ABC transporter ATP-binding protein [Natronoglycomyces albus]|uniref:ABC transporter ATP-binding protein n=1 Tax=Natronoglycomyces albus TaxID=2811108 RepID=A0A895XTQ3_9ACTN|nr:ABC transporter ATP-binding protein [Natronoglycomyces albus]QSB06695.1 ABC transporter ATP-binding protein [Natronoglycomyces albus]